MEAALIRWNTWWARYCGMPSYRRWYVASMTLGAIAFVVAGAVPAATLYAVHGLTGAGLLLSIGFVVWALPMARKAWESLVGKIVVSAINLIAFWLATVLAYGYVSDALGLPPQDFQLTTSLVAVVLFTPALAISAACILLLAGCVGMLAGTLLLGIRHRTEVPWHAMGAMALSVFVMLGPMSLGKPNDATASIIRHLAYLADYHPAPNYPGLDARRRVRLHENGIVSYMWREDGRMHLRACVYKAPSSAEGNRAESLEDCGRATAR